MDMKKKQTKQESTVESTPGTTKTEDVSRVDIDGNDPGGEGCRLRDADHGEALAIPIYAGQRP